MRQLIFFITISILIVSCSSTKSIDITNLSKGNTLYELEYSEEGESKSIVKIYKSKRNAKVKLDLTNENFSLTPYNLEDDFELVQEMALDKNIGSTEKKLKLLDKFATSTDVESATIVELDGLKGLNDPAKAFKSVKLYDDLDFEKSVPLRFNENKMVFQTLTIPFKIRGKEGDLPSTVATNFNAGIAYGYQWNLSQLNPFYGKNNQMVGYELEKLSFALAPFAGLTTVALTAENTEPDININQTVMGFSVGAAGVFSFNRLNLGLAVGIDHGFGRANDWVYQDKLWTGIVIGLDLIK